MLSTTGIGARRGLREVGQGSRMRTLKTTDSAQRAAAVARLVRRQAGAVARGQLLRLGFDDHAIAAQLTAHRWQVWCDGVYLTFTGPPPLSASRWAALLACGPGAVLSHQTAADVHGFSDGLAQGPLIHVTIPESRREVSPPGVRVHRSRLLPSTAEIRHGVAVTTAADTVLDLVAGTRSADTVVTLVTAACRCRATSVDALLVAMSHRKRQRHRWLVQAVCLDVRDGVESHLEREYLRRVERAHGLPPGRRQFKGRTRRGWIRRDVAYDEYRTAVELDGRRGHEGVGQHRDAARDNDTTEQTWQTLRYGHGSIFGEPCEVARQVAAVLRNGGWRGELAPCGAQCAALRKI